MNVESNQPLSQAAFSNYQELVWRLGFLRTRGAEPDPEPATQQILDWHKRLPANQKPLSYSQAQASVKTLNQHFQHLFPDQVQQYGQAFLEVAQRDDTGQIQTTPLCLNHDFFAASLSDSRLGLDVVYFEPDMQFYYNSAFDPVFKPVCPEKLQALYRGLILRSASFLKNMNGKLNVWAEFRSDKNARMVVQRAKSILAADSSFFSASSPHQRIKGVELVERVARMFVDQLLTAESGQILRLQEAYTTFIGILKLRSLPVVDKKQFKAMVVPLVREQFHVALRNDLPALNGEGLRGWKGIKIQSLPVLN